MMMMDDDRVMVAFHAPASFPKTDMQPVQQNKAPINV